MRTTLVAMAVGLGMLGSGACTPPNITGEPLKGPTTGEAFEGVKCSAVRPQTEPDLMAWDPGTLEPEPATAGRCRRGPL